MTQFIPVSDTGSARFRRGAALLAVLWIIALLIGLVAGASLLLHQDMDMSATRRQMSRARMLAEAGLALAMNPAVKPDDPLLRQEVAPGERFKVEMVGEDGLINPNVLLQRGDTDTLRRLFRHWGLQLQQADALIAALVDWVDADDFVGIQGAESRFYRRPGVPFNRPFRSVEEMALVRGMQELDALYPAWRNWFSVYASGLLDVNEAQPEIISALTGADIRNAQIHRVRRLGRDGIADTEDDDAARELGDALARLQLPASNLAAYQTILSVNSVTKRIIVHVQVGDLERQLGAVIRGAPGTGTTAILWMGER